MSRTHGPQRTTTPWSLLAWRALGSTHLQGKRYLLSLISVLLKSYVTRWRLPVLGWEDYPHLSLQVHCDVYMTGSFWACQGLGMPGVFWISLAVVQLHGYRGCVTASVFSYPRGFLCPFIFCYSRDCISCVTLYTLRSLLASIWNS